MGERICPLPQQLQLLVSRSRNQLKTNKRKILKKAKKILTRMSRMRTMRADKARRLGISHECRGVSPRRRHASHTSPGFPTFATLGVPESRASKVIRRRVLSVFINQQTDSARCTGGVVAARQPPPWGGHA